MAEIKGEEYKFPHEAQEAKGKPSEVDFEIEVEDDTPEEDRGRKPAAPVDEVTDEELASYDEKVQKRIKKFTRGYHDERRAKEEALRERQAAETFAKQVFEENKRLQQQLSTGSKAYIQQSQSNAESELVSAKKKYKDAYEAGDVDALTEAQAEIASVTLKIDKARNMRPVEVEEREYTPAQNAAPQQQKLTPRAQKWADANDDWWGKNEEMTMTAMGVDRRLQKEYGADYVGTEEYFRTIDKTMRKRYPEQFEDSQSEEPDEEPTPRRATRATVVAPAARSTSPNRIRLKTSEVATARRLGVPLEEYARQVALLKRG
jgi:hypothetical protein